MCNMSLLILSTRLLQSVVYPRFQFSGARRRSPTPHDSGVDDQDDTSIVPAETLRELLMRTFRLVPEKFHQYEQRIAQYYGNKQAEKVLR